MYSCDHSKNSRMSSSQDTAASAWGQVAVKGQDYHWWVVCTDWGAKDSRGDRHHSASCLLTLAVLPLQLEAESETKKH